MRPARSVSRVLVAAALLTTLGLAGCARPSPAGDDGGEPGVVADAESMDPSDPGGGGPAGEGPGGAGQGSEGQVSEGRGGGEQSGGSEEGGGAVPSPVRVPAFSQVGQDIDDAFPAIVEAVTEACDGEPCLELVQEVVEGDETSDLCAFSGLRPASGTTVERGSTLVVEVRCPPEPGESTEPQPEPGVEPEDTETTAPGGEGSTVPPEGGSSGGSTDEGTPDGSDG